MPNPSAYASGAAILGGVLLFLGLIWVVVVLALSSMDIISPHTIAKSLPGFVPDPTSSYSDVGTPVLQAAVPDQRGVGGDAAVQGIAAEDVSGTGVTDGNADTAKLYRERAERGDADAQYKLGLLFLVGEGALQDFGEAAVWLRRAADQGHAQSKYRLGLMYRLGHGVPIDLVQAYKWLNLAAAAGVAQAVGARNEVLRSLSPDQLAQAQKASRAWQPQATAESRESRTDKAAVPGMGPAMAMEGGLRGSATGQGQGGAKAMPPGTSAE